MMTDAPVIGSYEDEMRDVCKRAEALETAGARNQRLLAEARAVCKPDEISDGSEIVEVDEDESDAREIRADGGVATASAETRRPAHVGIDEATLTRDRRAAEQPMGTWPVAPGMWKVGTGSSDYSEYTVDVRDGRCTCSDWRFRGNPGSGKITRCKHLARVGMVLELLHPPADADVDATLVAQRERFSE